MWFFDDFVDNYFFLDDEGDFLLDEEGDLNFDDFDFGLVYFYFLVFYSVSVGLDGDFLDDFDGYSPLDDDFDWFFFYCFSFDDDGYFYLFYLFFSDYHYLFDWDLDGYFYFLDDDLWDWDFYDL